MKKLVTWARADLASQDKLVPCPKTISAQTKVSQILCGHNPWGRETSLSKISLKSPFTTVKLGQTHSSHEVSSILSEKHLMMSSIHRLVEFRDPCQIAPWFTCFLHRCCVNISPRAAQSTLVGVVVFSKVFISGTVFPLRDGTVRVSADACCLLRS